MDTNEQNRQKVRYNRILLERIPHEFCRPYILRPNEEIEVLDLSSLQFLIEEFMVLCATKIAIPEDSEIVSSIKYLDPVFRNRVVLIDKKRQSYRKLGAILAPIQEEFQVRLTKLDYPGAFSLSVEKEVPEKLHKAIPILFFNLRTFLLGIEYELQIELDLNSIKEATDTIRQNSKNPETRITLASLQGLFETYEQQKITSLGILPTAYEENLSLFQELIEEQIYKIMSNQSHSIGFPSLLHRSVTNIKRLTKQLLTETPYKQIITLSTKFISAAMKVPIPESEWAASLIRKKYLPPVISFDKAIEKAHEAWKSIDHKPIAPKGFMPENFIKIDPNSKN